MDGFLTARCERNEAGQRLVYIGPGVAERTSNVGYEGPKAPAPVCMQDVDGVWVPLADDAEHLINMETGERPGMASIPSGAAERLRSRWAQAGNLDRSLDDIAKRHSIITPKEWRSEKVEQSMNMRFLNGTERVLELGACMGRNSLVMATILNEHGGKLVSIEANPTIVERLRKARAASGLTFDIIDKPLSRHRMMVYKWMSRCIEPHDPIPRKWREVATTTLGDVKAASGVGTFDTLVVDCEGAFHGILKEFPGVMKGVTKVIIENDSRDAKEAEEIHQNLRDHGLQPNWSKKLNLCKGFPKRAEFWQCWVRMP